MTGFQFWLSCPFEVRLVATCFATGDIKFLCIESSTFALIQYFIIKFLGRFPKATTKLEKSVDILKSTSIVTVLMCKVSRFELVSCRRNWKMCYFGTPNIILNLFTECGNYVFIKKIFDYYKQTQVFQQYKKEIRGSLLVIVWIYNIRLNWNFNILSKRISTFFIIFQEIYNTIFTTINLVSN